MSYIPPKLWRAGEPFTPDDFNAYVKNNMLWLVDRDTTMRIKIPGGSDVTWTNTTLAAHPDLTTSASIIVPKQSVLMFNLLGTYRASVTGNRIIALDLWWREREVFLSTMTGTTTTNGLRWFRLGNSGQNLTYTFTWFQPDVPRGVHTFDLYVRVNGDTGAEERSDSQWSLSIQVL